MKRFIGFATSLLTGTQDVRRRVPSIPRLSPEQQSPTLSVAEAAADTLLCVCNFPGNTGFAWNFIEGLYADASDRLSASGVRTLVAYPRLDGYPEPLNGHAAQPYELKVDLRSFASVRNVCRFVRRERVRALYLTDRPAFSIAYLCLKFCGVKRIVVHDHTSGARIAPSGVRKAAKWLIARLPGFFADRVLAVSDYVANRNAVVGQIPRTRIRRVWNGIPLQPLIDAGGVRAIRAQLHLPPRAFIFLCCCRAAPEKGVQHLLKAFGALLQTDAGASRELLLVYVGDGPFMPDLRRLRDESKSRDRIRFEGYRNNVGDFIKAADVCVVPSVWQDALPLGVLEPMAEGKPVIGTRVGGVPEMVRDDEEGILVAPGDFVALRDAMSRMLVDAELRRRTGEHARRRVEQFFRPDDQRRIIAEELLEAFIPK
jgi:glycosyltransferase involved in cell wall biosynthesis